MRRIFVPIVMTAFVLLAACGPVQQNGDGDGGGGGGTGVDACGNATSGPTEHRGIVAADEIWTAAGSPHVLTAQTYVKDGVTVAIEPCALVVMGPDAELDVNGGTLVAEGTADGPIRFEPEGAERWGYLRVASPGTASLAYVTFEGGGADVSTYQGATIVGRGDSDPPIDPLLSVDHVTVRGSAGTGVWMRDYAAFTADSTDLVIEGSGADASLTYASPLRIEGAAMGSVPSGTYTGNREDAIRVESFEWIGASVDVQDRGVPYVFGKDIVVARDVASDPVPVLTLEAGVVFAFEKVTDYADLGLQLGSNKTDGEGGLVVKGTAEKPVVFTSAMATPAAGDWRDITFKSSQTGLNRIDYARIEYAGAGCSCEGFDCPAQLAGGTGLMNEDAALRFYWKPATDFVANTSFVHIDGWGIVRGWQGDGPDFTPTNSFEDLTYCPQSWPEAADGSCPAQPYVCTP